MLHSQSACNFDDTFAHTWLDPSEKVDIVDEAIDLFKANVFFKNYEVQVRSCLSAISHVTLVLELFVGARGPHHDLSDAVHSPVHRPPGKGFTAANIF